MNTKTTMLNSWLNYLPVAASVGGIVWSGGFIATGSITLRNVTGYDSWDMLWYLGMSTFGWAFFIVGALAAVTLLVLRSRSVVKISATPLWAGLLLNVVLAAVLMYLLKHA